MVNTDFCYTDGKNNTLIFKLHTDTTWHWETVEVKRSEWIITSTESYCKLSLRNIPVQQHPGPHHSLNRLIKSCLAIWYKELFNYASLTCCNLLLPCKKNTCNNCDLHERPRFKGCCQVVWCKYVSQLLMQAKSDLQQLTGNFWPLGWRCGAERKHASAQVTPHIHSCHSFQAVPLITVMLTLHKKSNAEGHQQEINLDVSNREFRTLKKETGFEVLLSGGTLIANCGLRGEI